MYYPDISDPVACSNFLKLVRKQVREDPDYLNHEDCPYPHELVEALNDLMLTSTVAPTVTSGEEVGDLNQDVDVAVESKQMYNEMRTLRKALQAGDTTERVQLYRICTSLLEKLLDYKERAEKVDQYAQFKAEIIYALEKYLTPQQRSEFVQVIESLR